MLLGGEITRLIKDCLFPVFCFGCHKEGEWWCINCQQKSFSGGEFYCPVCHLKNLNGKNCFNCQAVSDLTAVAAFFNYQTNQPVRELIKNFKYHFATDINNLWSQTSREFLNIVWQASGWPLTDLTLVPVPLHPRRQRERGFNQAQLIAENIFAILKKESKHIHWDSRSLQRVKFTQQQAKLNKQQRSENLKGAFAWRAADMPTKDIILIDDVFTSGATMQACARVLKQAGARAVYGLAMARD